MTIVHLAVVGSRDYRDLKGVRAYVRKMHAQSEKKDFHLIIYSGGAPGVDDAAVDEADRIGCDWREMPADWEKHGKAAGMLRNTDLVNEVDHVAAFWDGTSRGTRDTIGKAHNQGKLKRLECEIPCHGQDELGPCLGPICPGCGRATCLYGWDDLDDRRWHEECAEEVREVDDV